MELIILTFLLVFSVILEAKYRVVLYYSLKERFLVVGIVFSVLIIWELINRHVFQAWLYPGTGMIGVYILGLPLETYLFCLIAPYLSFLVYELIHKEVDRK